MIEAKVTQVAEKIYMYIFFSSSIQFSSISQVTLRFCCLTWSLNTTNRKGILNICFLCRVNNGSTLYVNYRVKRFSLSCLKIRINHCILSAHNCFSDLKIIIPPFGLVARKRTQTVVPSYLPGRLLFLFIE